MGQVCIIIQKQVDSVMVKTLCARGGGLGGDICKRASSTGLFEQRNGCASKVKITPTHAHTQGMGQEETLLFSCSWVDFVSKTLEMDLTSVQPSS